MMDKPESQGFVKNFSLSLCEREVIISFNKSD